MYMSTFTLSDSQWSKIVSFLKTCPDIYTGQQTDLKRFINAVLWITRSGSQWRLLPKQYGNWNSVYKRFARWCDKDIFQRMHQHFAKDPDMEWLIIDSTIIRAHPCAGGALKTSGGQASQALGRSRGGFSTKIHIAVDGLGNPLHFMLTAGQRHDITCAEALIDGYNYNGPQYSGQELSKKYRLTHPGKWRIENVNQTDSAHCEIQVSNCR